MRRLISGRLNRPRFPLRRAWLGMMMVTARISDEVAPYQISPIRRVERQVMQARRALRIGNGRIAERRFAEAFG